jgi:hypothetical protein
VAVHARLLGSERNEWQRRFVEVLSIPMTGKHIGVVISKEEEVRNFERFRETNVHE